MTIIVVHVEPEVSTSLSGVIPIAVLKEVSNVEISVLVFRFYFWKLNYLKYM